MTSKLSLLIDRNRLYESRFFLPCIKKHEKYCSTPTNKVLKDMFPKKRTLKIRQKIVTKGSSISESNSFTAATNQKLSNHSIIAATNRLKRLVKIRNWDITHILQKYKSNRWVLVYIKSLCQIEFIKILNLHVSSKFLIDNSAYQLECC